MKNLLYLFFMIFVLMITGGIGHCYGDLCLPDGFAEDLSKYTCRVNIYNNTNEVIQIVVLPIDVGDEEPIFVYTLTPGDNRNDCPIMDKDHIVYVRHLVDVDFDAQLLYWSQWVTNLAPILHDSTLEKCFINIKIGDFITKTVVEGETEGHGKTIEQDNP